jgi:anti-sigma factor RsiW
MIKTFTHETLLRYVYNELPAKEHQEVEKALLHDAELAASCADLLLAQRALNGLRRSPSQRTTDALLQYSRTFLRKD